MSDIKVTKDLSKDISSATNIEEIRNALMDAAVNQGVLTHGADGDFLPAAMTSNASPARDENGRFVSAQPKFGRHEVIGGKRQYFEAASEVELEKIVTAAYRAAMKTERTEVSEQQHLVDKVELDLKFKRGEMSAADYLSQSGAVDEYLAAKGVSVDELQQVVNKDTERSWAQATQEFLNSDEGHDWPGGAKNLELIGLTIQSLGLVDAEDKTAALIAAYNEMKRTGMLFDGPVSANEIAQDASPEEIVDAYKKSVQAQGRDLNTEFVKTYSGGRLKYS